MNLKDILAKNAEDLTVKEIAFLKTKQSEMSAEEKTKFADVLSEKEIDAEALKTLLSKTAGDAIAAKVGEISDGLVSKFMDGVKDARSKAIDTETAKKNEVKGAETRAFMKAMLSGDIASLKAMERSKAVTDSSADDAKAGLTIPVELRNEVLRIAELQYGLARKEMLYLPFSGPGASRVIPTLGTSVTVKWTEEGAKKQGTEPSFGIVTQILKKLAAIVPMTEEILEDSAIDIVALLGQLFAEAVSKEEDLQFFAGTGAPWTGILNNGSVNKVTQASGDASQLTADDLLDMIDATPTGALSGAKFYMHRSILSVIRKLKGTDGQYIYQNPGQGLPATIWNYPVVTSDAFPALADVDTGDQYVLFGNLKQGAVFGDKQQLRVKMLDQATVTDGDGSTVINLAEQDMVALRIVERVGYVIALPTALTVLEAQETQS
jgi:HK97 family phage major capsid protein